MTKQKIFLLLALVFGLLIRTVGLSSRPDGFTWDEAALGYNAYSLLQTGRDEHGQALPLVFKSFGDYKPGLYIYFTVLPTGILGLNEFSTRLPSAVFGVLTIFVLYVLCRQLFPQNKSVAWISLAVSSLNPWLIHFSRGAWEANLSLFLTVLGVTLFLRYLPRKSVWAIYSSVICFGLTFLAYQGAKLFTPLLVTSLIIIYFKQLNLRHLLLPGLLGLLLVLPVLVGLSAQSGRLKVFSVFSYTRSADHVDQLLSEDAQTRKNWLFYLFHSEGLDQFRGVAKRYLNHLSPRFLFVEGDWTNLRHAEYKHGYFYFVDLLGLLAGLYFLLKSKSKSVRLLAAWLFMAPLPAALSRDLVSGVRALPLVIPLVILISVGLSRIIRSKLYLYILLPITAFLWIYFFEFYLLHAKFYAADQWVSPYKQAVQVISENLSDYSHVYFTNQLGQPYIFILYYLQLDPAVFQRQAVYKDNRSGDVGEVLSFGKFSFQPIFWPSLRGGSDAIFVGGQYELPEKDLDFPGVTRLADIYYPNGAPALRIVGLD